MKNFPIALRDSNEHLALRTLVSKDLGATNAHSGICSLFPTRTDKVWTYSNRKGVCFSPALNWFWLLLTGRCVSFLWK